MPAPALRLSDIDLDTRMRSSYLDYAMSVIVSRALPDARDGMKPVHRRVLYGMYELGLRSTNAYKKSARVVGDVLGKYHPHGDTAVYEALVRMAQDFAMRYPLVDGQGNFGSIDGDSAAAMRYTEVRLTPLAEELLADIDKNTVPFADNFDGSMQEPLLLPARVPMLLLNGAAGIAVGMATNIPPHNLNELCDAIITLVDNPDASVEEFVRVMPGPDFPTGGQIVGREGIDSAYATGSGKITVRATVLVESEQKGRETLVVTELPYQVNKSELIKKIAELARERKIEGIAGLRDESDRNGLRITIDLKASASAEKVLAALYQKTNLQVTFGINMLGLLDNTPHTLSLKQSLSAFIEHRRQVITRRVEFDLDEATDRRHILEGLALALKNLDKIIALIRQAKNAEAALNGLMEGFGLSQVQARAILDMQLRRLAALERQKVLDEMKEVQKLVAELETILASPTRVLEIMKNDLRDLQTKYGDARRTRIVEQGAAMAPAALADLLPQQQTVVALSFEGYLKRLDTATGRNAGRDPITRYIEANTRDTLYLISAQGTAFSLPVHRVEAVGKRSDRGTSAHALVDLADSDSVVAALPVPNDEQQRYLVIATRRGMVKRTLLSEYTSARNAGILALRLDEGDTVIAAALTTGQDEIMLGTAQGKVIRFGEDEVRPTGRVAGGVRGIKLSDGDSVLPGPLVVPRQSGSLIVTLTTKGAGKKTPLTEYPMQGRDGSGVQAARLTPKNGGLAMILFAPPRGGTIECITSDRRVGVIELSEIPARDRAHPGDPLVDSIATANLRPK